MNPPDLKHSMNPNPNLKFYHLGCGFIAGTGEPGNWKSPITLMTLVLSIPLCLPGSTIRNRVGEALRNTRCLWSSLIPSRGAIRLENPDSGFSGYQVELDGFDVSRSGNCGEPSDSGSGWFSLASLSNETTVVLATGYNEALEASMSNEFYWLRLRAGRHAPAPLAVRERFSTPNA